LAGQSVVLDAVFAMQDQRETAEALAAELDVPFTGIWVDAPEEVRIDRVLKRERNVSDITPEIARSQSDYDLGEMTWASVNSAGEKTETVAQGLRVLGV
jgi:predicted kinase